MAENGYRPLQAVKTIRWWEWVLMIILTITPLVGGFIGARMSNTGKYKNNEFDKPSWSPPSTVFSPVWSILYLMMGFSSYLLWKLGGGLNRETVPPLLLYALQLLLNWCWTPEFFGNGNFGAALIIVCAVWGLSVSCVVTFAPSSKLAAVLLLPYLVWLSFAAALNYSVVCLNGCKMTGNSTTGF